ncbi:MAG: TolC family protein [Kiritimatiellaeota bacterium]|nr:TolC family protein [Kiritimatiellota bacterium]
MVVTPYKGGWHCFVAPGLVGLGVLLSLAGCMTPERADRQASEAGTRLATAYWQAQTGRTNTFDVTRPADALTLRLALTAIARGEENVVFPEIPNVSGLMDNDVWRLPLADALNVAARNDRQYQRLKEDVFRAALDLDSQRFLFETSFTGLLLGLLSGNSEAADTLTGNAGAGFSRQLENGATIAGQLALDVVRLLRSDWHSLGITGDLSMSIPLLRGSGRKVVREPLTQAERNLMYAIRRFEHYRQTYAVAVASGYFGVLEYAQRLKNAQDNEKRLILNSERAEMMYEEERKEMGLIEVSQARSDLLAANEGVVAMRRTYEERLDTFKLTIGLPPESRIELDNLEFETLQQEIEAAAQEGTGGERMFPDEPDACAIALRQRMDLSIVYDSLGDAERGLSVAADALRADVALTGSARAGQTGTSESSSFSGTESWGAGLRMDLPWNRRRERNAYKRQLIAIEQAKRDVEEKEDAIKAAVRNGLRKLAAAEASYKIQVAALGVAELRVASNTLFMELGRSTMRDMLEAQSTLLQAQNNLCNAVIGWRISELELRRDMGVLAISETGVWEPMEAYVEDNG